MLSILLIASEEAAPTLIRHLTDSGAEHFIATSPEAALNHMRETAVSGIIINMPTFIRMGGKGKLELSEVLALFPVLRCRIDRQDSLTVFDNVHPDTMAAFSHFLHNVCLKEPKRIIRKKERAERHCCLLLSSDSQLAPTHTERTMTINIALDGSGCFCFSAHIWKPGQSVWLQFLDLDDKTPITAEVTHTNRWGKGCTLPGCGLQFTSVTDMQKEQLKKLCHHFSSLVSR